MQKRVTLSIEVRAYEEFRKFCSENDIILSKRVERLMKRELDRNENKTTVKMR